MIYEIRKALEALFHPGVDTNLPRMIRNAIPYYISPRLTVPKPITIYWSINSVCNMQCKMCDIGMKNKEGTFYKNLAIDGKLHEIDIAVFKSVIDQVASSKPFIVFNSTEPLLYAHLNEAVEYCTARELKTAVTTNGYILPGQAAGLVRAGLRRMIVSLDGPPAIHNAIRGRKDSFERASAGLEEFAARSREAGLDNEIFISFVISSMNYESLVEFTRCLRELPAAAQVNFVYLWFISPENAAEHNKLFGNRYPVNVSCFDASINPFNVDVDALWTQIQNIRDTENIHFIPSFSVRQLHKYFHDPSSFMRKKSCCLASWFIIQILADGNVIPYARCHNNSFGNINERSFEEIWNGNEMRGWRRFIRQQKRMPMCKRCDLNY